jgi:hypothetical protein
MTTDDTGPSLPTPARAGHATTVPAGLVPVDVGPQHASSRIDILRDLLERNTSELQFWRERNWSALKLTLGGIVGLGGASVFTNRGSLLSIVILAIAIISTIYQTRNWGGYADQVDLRARLEAALGLYTTGQYLQGTPLLRPKFEALRPARWGTGAFVLATWVVTIAAIVAIFLET